MTRPEIVSVEVEHPCGPLREWEEAISRHVGRVDPAFREQEAVRSLSLNAQRFTARLEHGVLGDALLCRVRSTAYRFSRSLTTPKPTLPTPTMLVWVSRGSCRFVQRGQTCTLDQGDWTLIDTRQPLEYAVTSAEFEAFVFMAPRSSDESVGALLERGIARRWSGRTGLSRVLQGMVTESFGEMRRLPSASGRRLGRAIAEMAWDALREQVEAPPSIDDRDQRMTRIKRYIETQLADPELSIEDIAEACEISVRGLHRLFMTDPAGSVSRYLWLRRLTRCADVLRDPSQEDRSITDVCFSYGFNSSSHFSRMFRSRYGVPPARFRAETTIKLVA